MRDFLAFRTMISAGLIKIIYPLGAVGIVALALWAMFFVPSSPQASGFIVASGPNQLTVVQGISLMLFGNLGWRICCEQLMVFFAIHAALAKGGGER